MSRFINGIKSFVHSISTSDHYASYDPSRPQGLEDTAPLAMSDERRSSSSSLGQSYVPGMRSAQMASSSTNLTSAVGSGSGRDSIQLTDMTPIPSAQLSWDRIDAWIEQNYPELHDQLLGGATTNDLNDLEHDLGVQLPQDVRESLSVHDGQEPGGKPTGLFFGIFLLDLESISSEWSMWRRMSAKIEELSHRAKPQASSSSSPRTSGKRFSAPAAVIGVPGMNLGWIERQKCCPPDTVQQVYAHPAWVPLAKDRDGNNIAVDLAPGPKGRYGQVILFGRDFDTKFVVAPSWGDFLAQFAADLESGQNFIDDDIEDAVFAFKAPNGQLVSYFSVLRGRVERTLPKQPQQQPQQPQRRSMSNVASVSNAPPNTGRVTPRLISPISSSSSLPLKDPKSRSRQALAGQLNEVDLNDPPKDTHELEPKKQQPVSPTENKPKAAKSLTTHHAKNEDKHEHKEAKESKAEPKESKVESKEEETKKPQEELKEKSKEESKLETKEPVESKKSEEASEEISSDKVNEDIKEDSKEDLKEKVTEEAKEDEEKEPSEEPEAKDKDSGAAAETETKTNEPKSKKKNKKKSKN